MANWTLNLRFGQLILVWAACSGIMIAVFLFGLFAGREQGIQHALAGQENSSLKLPVSSSEEIEAKPLAVTSDTTLADKLALKKTLAPEKTVVEELKTKQVKAPKILAKMPDARASLNEVEAKPKKETKKEVEKDKSPKLTIRQLGELKKGWYVQVLAANTEREAAEISSKLEKKGLKTSIQLAKVKKIKYYRVLVGPFTNEALAKKKQSQINSLKAAPSTPFIKKIN